jgi:hypothetical protein
MTFVRATLALLAAAPIFAADTITAGAGNSLIAHEWGTFTSVSDADGTATVWGALGGPADLPCFVYRQPMIVKGGIFTRVRMETPVVYFYSAHPTTASVRVRFPMGLMTEWYPRAEAEQQVLAWKNIEVLPGRDLEYPTCKGDSHYYAARATDSAALRVEKQQEKLLFYRGTGNFQPPALPRFTSKGLLDLRGVDRGMVFENRGGKIGWRVVNGPRPVERPELTGDVTDLRAALTAMLTEAGLYEKEARAMVETWRDSWFEEGLRVLYLVPREFVDRVLPLEITPRPREIARVFMGRAEVLAPERREALARAVAEGDVAGFEGYGRFFTAFARQVMTLPAPRVAGDFVAAKERAIAQQVGGSCVQ